MKIAVLASRFPYPLEKGDKLRLYHILKGLSNNHDIYLLSLDDRNVKEDWKEKLRPFTKEIFVFSHSKWMRISGIIKYSVFSNLPFQTSIFYDKEVGEQINEILSDISPQVVLCHLVRMAEYCRNLSYPCVIDYMDAFSYSMKKRSEISTFPMTMIYKIEAERMKLYEKEMWKYFDRHFIISDQDKRYMSLDSSDLKIVRNGVDTTFFRPQNNEKKYGIGFIGNLGYLPNIEAAEYLVNQILDKKNSTKVLICGARPPRRIKRYNSKNISIIGWIEDIRTAYGAIKILVAPIFKGTGLQNKILESMAMGVPCITTQLVNNAIGAVPDEEIIIANSPDEFSDKIDMLMEDIVLYNKIRDKAITFVRKNYGWTSQIKKLEHFITELKE